MKAERFEGLVQVLILILVASMAGAASFTHVHNWTMHNAPPGTGSWFGWANAVISELTPTAAGIEIRRRRRRDRQAHIAYPMAILIAAAVLSLSAQVAEARPTVGGWISSAVPALAFLALTKLVLSRAGQASVKEDPECVQPASNPGAQTQISVSPPAENSARATATSFTSPTPLPLVHNASSLDASALIASPSSGVIQPVPSAQLLASARMTAFAHRQATGNPITTSDMAAKLGVPPALAESLIDHIGGTPPPVTEVNGTVVNGSRP